MNSPPARTILTWVPLTIAIVTGAIAWGSSAERVSALEEKAATAQSDHDSIVTMQAQMTTVQTDIGTVKGDIKGIQRTMNENFTKIMIELRTRPTPSGG